MTNKKDIHVVPHNDGWATKREGGQRVSDTGETQREMIDRARDQAKKDRVEVVIHRPNGQIRDSDSYGRDPNPPKDKKH